MATYIVNSPKFQILTEKPVGWHVTNPPTTIVPRMPAGFSLGFVSGREGGNAMHSPSAADTSESAAEPVFKSARREGRHPDNHIAVCTVDKAPYVGMELDVYESPETNLYDSQITFYMRKCSRKKFPLVEHVQAKRTMDGIAIPPSIRLRERLLHDGTLRCATCPRVPSAGHGTMHFIMVAFFTGQRAWASSARSLERVCVCVKDCGGL